MYKKRIRNARATTSARTSLKKTKINKDNQTELSENYENRFYALCLEGEKTETKSFYFNELHALNEWYPHWWKYIKTLPASKLEIIEPNFSKRQTCVKAMTREGGGGMTTKIKK